MGDSFGRALAFVLRWEGGYTDNPADPGGATNKGITQRTYDAWRAKKRLPARPVREIKDSEVEAIYREEYWVDLPWPLALVHFDTRVNMGSQKAAGLLCASAGAVDSYLKKRRAYYMTIVRIRPQLTVFLRGWLNRLDALEKEAV